MLKKVLYLACHFWNWFALWGSRRSWKGWWSARFFWGWRRFLCLRSTRQTHCLYHHSSLLPLGKGTLTRIIAKTAKHASTINTRILLTLWLTGNTGFAALCYLIFCLYLLILLSVFTLNKQPFSVLNYLPKSYVHVVLTVIVIEYMFLFSVPS